MTRYDNHKGTRGLYRSRNGLFLGVCRGLAEYFDVSIKWTRIICAVAIIFTGFWPGFAFYLLAAFLLKPEPILPPADELEEEFYNSYASSRAMALQRLKHKFDHLDKRIQRIKNHVTTREFS